MPITLPQINGDTTIDLTAPDFVSVAGRAGPTRAGLPVDGFIAVRESVVRSGVEWSAANERGACCGRFVLRGLISGATYDVSASFCCENGSRSYLLTKNGYVADGSQPLDLTFPVSQVSYFIHDQAGNPIVGAYVHSGGSTILADGLQVADSGGNTSVTDALGHTSDLLPTGYSLGNSGFASQLYLSNGLVVPITLPQINGDTTIDLTAPDFVSVAGRAGPTRAGLPVDGFIAYGRVSFVPVSSGVPQTSVALAADGSFSAGLISGATYDVSASFCCENGSRSYLLTKNGYVADGSQPLDLTFPVSQVSYFIHDQAGNPIVGAYVHSGGSTILADGLQVADSGGNTSVTDALGHTSDLLPTGYSLGNSGFASQLYLSNGLVVPITLPQINGDTTIDIIFDASTGTVQVQFDNVPPVVTGSLNRTPNAAGWYNAPVTISWSASDPAPSSGTPTTPASTVSSTEGANVVYTSGPSCDPQGNCATGSLSLSIDQTAPVVSVAGVSSGGLYALGAVPTASCAASDPAPGSGLVGPATLSRTGGNPDGTGTFTATCAVSDVAGNHSSASVSYRVLSTFSMGPQAMEGDLKVAPGSTLKAGYSFTMPGNHPAATVTFVGACAVFQATCVSGTGTATLTVPMTDQTYQDGVNSSAWLPSGDQSNAATYQGSVTVPDVCGGGLVRLQKGGTFTAGVTSTDKTDKVNVRWHYRGTTDAGGWSGTLGVVPD